MKHKRVFGFGLALTLAFAGQALHAQQSHADGKRLVELRAQAEKGDAEAQCNLGQKLLGPTATAQERAEGVKWCRRAAEQNHAQGQFVLGICYLAGLGVEKDEAEVVRWWRKAAEQNLPHAQYELGGCYRHGQGVTTNAVEAVKWYRKAAEQNFPPAQYELGACYAEGQGVAQDMAEAVEWLRKAAEQNYGQAQFALAIRYVNGQGVAKDEAEAYKWVILAAAQNHEKAKQNQPSLEGTLSPDQIAEGKRRANDWLEQHKQAPGGGKPETLSAAQTANKQIEIQGSFGGIGAKLEKTNGVLRVASVFAGGPAERASLRVGWEIASINGAPTRSMTVEDAIQLIRGPIGTEIALEAVAPGGAARKVSLTREKVLLSPISSKVLEGGWLLLRLGVFDQETPGAVRAKLLARSPETKGIVLDLRDSPGGVSRSLEEVAGLLLPRDSFLWSLRSLNGRLTHARSSAAPVCELPLVVLVNRRTLSAELLASALQHNQRARIIGQPTSGFAVTNGPGEMVKNPDGTSHIVKRGSFVLEQGRPNVVPDTILPDSASDNDFSQAATEALAGASAPPAAPAGAKPTAAARLKQLKELHEKGLLPRDAYDQKVKEIMDAL